MLKKRLFFAACIAVCCLLLVVAAWVLLKPGNSSQNNQQAEPDSEPSLWSDISAAANQAWETVTQSGEVVQEVEFAGEQTAREPSEAEVQNEVSHAELDAVQESSPEAEQTEPLSECAADSSQQPSKEVLLNEIAWMGTVSADGQGSAEASGNEWIELYRNPGLELSLTRWQLVSGDGKLRVAFGEGEAIAGGEFFLLERDDDETVPTVRADKIYKGTLSNNGENLFLLNDKCVVIDKVEATKSWPGGNASTRRTLERDIDGIGWHTSAASGGTPGAPNSQVYPKAYPVPISTSTPARAATSTPTSPTTVSKSTAEDLEPVKQASSTEDTVVPEESEDDDTTTSSIPITPAILHIVEVQIIGKEGETDHDLIKIYNAGTNTVNLSGWKLRKRTKSGSESSIKALSEQDSVAPGEIFIWANSKEGFALSIGAHTSSTQTLAANASVALLNSDNTVIDAVAWGSDHENPFSEGTASPENPAAGQVLSRKRSASGYQDTSDNGVDFELQ